MARVVESLTGDRMVSARPKRTTAQRLSSFADDDDDDDEEGEEEEEDEEEEEEEEEVEV